MLRSSSLLLLSVVAACGGGGGGGTTTPPATGPVRVGAAAIEVPANANTADVLVDVTVDSTPAPVLLELAVEVPNGLSLPATQRLAAVAPLVTLDGDFVNQRFVVLCGDAQNVSAAPLASGPLFRLRIAPSTPRVPGTYTLKLLPRRAASQDGQAVAFDTTPTTVDVVVR